MKKFLFGTTAIAAVAMAGVASAKDVELGLGGYMRVGAAYVSEPEAAGLANDDEEFVLIRDGEIHFKGKGTLDNGLTIEARVELEAFTTGDQIDENWVRVSSSFGQVMIGGNDNAAINAGYVGFTSTFINHANADGTLNFTPAEIGTLDQQDDIGIHYYTPTIAGFQLGVSYQPDETNDGGDDAQFTGEDDDGEYDDKIALGASYSNSFGDFDFTIGGGYITAEASTDGIEDLQEYGIGAEVGFAGFQVNGRYEYSEGGADVEIDRFMIGANYSTGPWTFGAGYAYAEVDTTGGSDELQHVSVGADYALGDGVTVGGGVEWGDVDSGEDGFAGALLLGVSF